MLCLKKWASDPYSLCGIQHTHTKLENPNWREPIFSTSRIDEIEPIEPIQNIEPVEPMERADRMEGLVPMRSIEEEDGARKNHIPLKYNKTGTDGKIRSR